MIMIARLKQRLMKKISSKHQKKSTCKKRIYGWYVLFLKIMKLLMNNKRQTYNSPQVFSSNLSLQPRHWNMIISWRKNSFKTQSMNKKSWMLLRIRRKIKIFSNKKLIIKPRIATFMRNHRELILLKHGSKAFLAKK